MMKIINTRQKKHCFRHISVNNAPIELRMMEVNRVGVPCLVASKKTLRSNAKRRFSPKNLSRPGIEPGSQAWQAWIIPLNQRDRFLLNKQQKWSGDDEPKNLLLLEWEVLLKFLA